MILDEISAYLVAQGFGTAGTNIFTGFLPDSPDVCVGIFETTSEKAIMAFHSLPGEIVLELPHFQVICRTAKREDSSTFYSDARTKAQNIYKKLHGLGNTTLSGVNYQYIEALQGPGPVRRDENERVWIGCNYRAAKRLS